MERQRLFLIDGVSYAYRSYYAIQRLASSKGTPTNAVFGFVRTLKKLIEDFHPEYIVAAFDPKGPTFRHEKFTDYKIQRKPMPEDLMIQLPLIKKLLDAFEIPVIEVEGYEADDVMGTLAVQGARRNLDVYLVTGDKDMFQLVDEHIKVLHTHKDNKIYDEQGVKERYGIKPKQIIDLLALSGDTSDNVPGVPGIGEKTAMELIQNYGSAEEVLKNVEKIPGKKRQENLKNNVELAMKSKELVVIDTKVPIQLDLKSSKFDGPDKEKLLELYKELEFSKLREELLEKTEEVETDYRLINSSDELPKLVQKLNKVKNLSIDVEATTTDPISAEMVGISLSFVPKQAYYIPLNGNIEKNEIIKALKPLLENPRINLIGQNIKYDMLVLSQHGIDLNNIAFDTMVAAYLLNPEKMRYKLDNLSIEYLNYKMISINELIGTGSKQISMKDVPIETVCRYSCEDADITLQLKNIFEKELKSKKLDQLFAEIEMPLIKVLADMELNGVSVDTKFLGQMSKEFQAQMDEISAEIYELAGEKFNLNSPKQLSVILFEKLKLPVQKRTKTGTSTDVEVLEKLARLHPLPKKLLDYRQWQKLKSTYIDALPGLINTVTKRIHTSFNQTITSTGRLSSSNPNLQIIPVRTEEGKRIRRAFIPAKKDWLLLSADYSQIELRIFAHLAEEPAMIEAFKRDEDIHAFTASLIFNCPLKDVTEEMRHRAKAVNFGIIYGQQAFGLSNYLNIPVSEAQAFIDEYYARYKKVKEYMDKRVEEAERLGYASTICNRRRYIPELQSKSNQTWQLGKRLAINTPIQGSAADLIKIAMINIYRKMKKQKLKSKMIIQIHDELIFEIPKNEQKTMQQFVKKEMESVMKLKVPLKVDIKVGKNWEEI